MPSVSLPSSFVPFQSWPALPCPQQVDAKNAHGKYKQGCKVTAVVAVPSLSESYLVSTNDSSIRLYCGYAQEVKYKGHKNVNTQVGRGTGQSRGEGSARMFPVSMQLTE